MMENKEKEKEANEELFNIKKEYDLREIAVFDKQGHVLQTTQEEPFTVAEEFYSRLGEIIDIIAKRYEQKCYGVTITFEDTELFLQIDRENVEIPSLEGEVLGIEYEPGRDIDSNQIITKIREELENE